MNINRIIFYLSTCILFRCLIVLFAKYLSKENLKLMGLLTLIPAFGFIFIYFTGIRKTGIEVSGNKIWWDNLRPIHSLLYFIFSYMAINGKDYSYIVLLIDVIIGIFSFLINIF